MTIASVAVGAAISESERATLIQIATEKMRDACWIDLVVGLLLLVIYGEQVFSGDPAGEINLWPAIVALGIVRLGNTIKQAMANASYWRWHKEGETKAAANV